MVKTIAVVGLGLIGGSMAKAMKQYTDHTVYGLDTDEKILSAAKQSGAIDDVLTHETIGQCHMVIVALYPKQTIEFVKTHVDLFQKGAVIVDCAGTKTRVCENLSLLAHENGFYFIGGHPMAGTEKSGFDYSFPELFKGASMIICEDKYTLPQIIDELKTVFISLGFGRLQLTNAVKHDEIIAYTSQLPHVVSNAFVKSETVKKRDGFSANSYKDLTRVAELNENMWTELFLENSEPLAKELDEFILRLNEYAVAIKEKDSSKLKRLLIEGTLAKKENG